MRTGTVSPAMTEGAGDRGEGRGERAMGKRVMMAAQALVRVACRRGGIKIEPEDAVCLVQRP